MADGSIVFNTRVDNEQAVKDLKRLNSRIKTLTQQIEVKTSLRLPIAEQANQMAASLDAAKAKLESMKAASTGVFTDDQIKAQAETVKAMQTEWGKVQSQVESYDKSIKNAQREVDALKNKSGELEQTLAGAASSAGNMNPALKSANKTMDRFLTRVKGLVSRVFVFTLITSALRSIRSYLGSAIKANDEASAAIARLKGALLTLAQLILSIVIPAFTALARVLTSVISTIAQLFAMLTGTTIESAKDSAKSLEEETNAIQATGTAAEDASKSLASFDEINKLSESSSGGGASAAGGSTEGISPDFNFEANFTEDQLQNILGLVEAIGSAFLAWKLGSSLGLGLKETLGLALAIYSGVQLVKNLFNAWTEGVTWDNLNGALLSATGLVAGLGIAFGTTAAAVGALVSGIALLVTGFHDAMENGWSLENVIMSISGILLTGMGIAALVGSWIPLLIAGIASALLAFTVATGHGEELIAGIKMILQGFIDFFTGIFTGDIGKAIGGVEKIFDGLKIAVSAVVDGIKDAFISFLNWLDEKTGGKLHGIIEFAKSLFTAAFDSIKTTLSGFIDGVKQIFVGIVKFVSGIFTQDWDKAWEGVKDIFKGAWNGIVSLLEGAVNIIIKGINWLIEQLNKVHFDVPDWVPVVGGKSIGINIPKISEIQIPRLSQGAVIPPNREFLAVLGDQKNGTNIEAPLSTIEQAVANVIGRMEYGQEQTVILQVDRQQLGKVVYKLNKEETRRIGVNLAGD